MHTWICNQPLEQADNWITQHQPRYRGTLMKGPAKGDAPAGRVCGIHEVTRIEKGESRCSSSPAASARP